MSEETELATLGVVVKGSGVKETAQDLKDLTQSGGQAERQSGELTKATEMLEASIKSLVSALSSNTSATNLNTASTRQHGEAELQTARATDIARQASDQLAATLLREQREQMEAARAAKEHADLLRRAAGDTAQMEARVLSLRTSIDPLVGVQDRLNKELKEAEQLYKMGFIGATEYANATDVLKQRLAGVTEAHGRGVTSSKAMTQASLNLTRQLADVGVTAAMGMNPLMILIQQGPQIADAFQMASSQGLGFKAVLRGLAAEASSLMALVGPFVLVGGAIAGLAIAAEAGAQEQANLNNMLAITGQQSKFTAKDFSDMSKTVAKDAEAGIGQARGVMMQFAETGKYTAETIRLLSTNVIDLAQYTGKSTSEFVTLFNSMDENVTDFAVKFNKSYKLITLDQYEHIRLLEEEGKTMQAQELLARSVHEGIAKTAVEQMGIVERAWRGVTRGIEAAIDAAKSFGRERDIGEKRAKITEFNSQIAMLDPNDSSEYRRSQRNMLVKLRDQYQKDVAKADAEAAQSSLNGRQVAAAGRLDTLRDKIDDPTGLKTALKQFHDDLKLTGNKLNKTEVSQIEESLRKQYNPISYQSPSSSASAAERSAMRGLRVEDKTADALAKFAKERLSAEMALTQDTEKQISYKKAQIAAEASTALENVKREIGMKRINGAMLPVIEAAIKAAALDKAKLVDQQAAWAAVQEEAQARQSMNAFLDTVGRYASDMATSVGEQTRLERQALQRRQQFEAWRLEAENAERVKAESLTTEEAAAERLRQSTLQFAEREAFERKKQLEAIRLDVELQQDGYKNDLDILNSKKARAQSAFEASKLDEQILSKQHEAEQKQLASITLENGYKDYQVRQAKDRIAVNDEIYQNELKQLKSSYSAAQAYADLATSIADVAQRAAGGDFGGALTTAQGALKQLAGLANAAGKTGLGDKLGQFAGYAGVAGQVYSAVSSVVGIFADKSAAKAQAKLEAISKGVEDLKASNMTSSNSVLGALEQGNRLWNQDLEYSSNQLSSLRSINDKIGSLAASVGQAITVGKMFDTSNLGLGTSSKNGSGLFGLANILLGGKKTTTELADQGLNFNATTYGQVANGGISASTYADLVSTTVSKFLGITTGTKVKTSTVSGAVDGDLLSQVGSVIKELGVSVIEAASTFGEQAAESAAKALENANIDIGKLSFKDLSGEEIEKLLNATFSKVADDLASVGIPNLDKLAKAGEGAFETLVRLSREYKVFDVAMTQIGKTFSLTGLASLEARERVIKLAGSLEDFVSQTSFFADNFLTEAEKLAPMQKTVADEMNRLGLSAVTTKDQFKQVVLGLDITTEKGASVYSALMKVAPAFLKVAEASEAAATAATDEANAKVAALKLAAETADKLVETARSNLQKAYDAEISVLQSNLAAAQDKVSAATAKLQKAYDFKLTGLESNLSKIEDTIGRATQAIRDSFDAQRGELKSVIDYQKQYTAGLKAYRGELSNGPSAALSPEEQYNVSKALFQSTLSAAQGGDKTAQGNFSTVSKAFLDASKQYNATGQAYFSDYQSVVAGTDSLVLTSETALTVAEQQLAALDRQEQSILGTTSAVMSLEEAVKALQNAEAAKRATEAQIEALKSLVDPLLGIDEATTSVEEAIKELLSAQQAQELAEREIKALEDLVKPLLTVNDSVLSVKDAINGLGLAIEAAAAANKAAVDAANAAAAAAAAQAAQAASANQAAQNAILKAIADANKKVEEDKKPELPTTSVVYTWSDYLKDNPDVVSEFNSLSKNNLKNNYGITTMEEFAQWHYTNHGASEGRKGAGTYTTTVQPNNDNYVTNPVVPVAANRNAVADAAVLQETMDKIASLLQAGLSQNAAISQLSQNASAEVKEALDTLSRRVVENAS